MTGEEGCTRRWYSMRASRLEHGVFWSGGSNDGPVWMTRDDGQDVEERGRRRCRRAAGVHTIEDSPHRKGLVRTSPSTGCTSTTSKPYLVHDNDYGAH